MAKKNVLEPPKTPPRGRRKIEKGWTSIKIRTRKKILTILARSPLTFTELKEEMGFSDMGIARHLRELEERGYVRRNRIGDRRVYEVQEIPNIEEIIIEALANHLGQLITIRLLEARVRGEKKLHIEEFYDVEGFLDKFIEDNFPRFRNVGSEALLEAFKKKYGKPTI